MKQQIKTYLTEESGAVTVDWVVLTAAVVGLGVAGVSTVQDGVTSLATDISSAISSKAVSNGD